MTQKGIAKAIAGVLEDAKELANAVKMDTAKAMEARANADKIAAICEFLLTSKPMLEPNYDNIVERGTVLYAKFPARQTLKNYYRKTVSVWRSAYFQIVNLLASEQLDRALTATAAKEGGSDSGATIAILRANVRRLKAELDRHRHVTAEMVPQNTHHHQTPWNVPADKSDNQILNMGSIRKWITSLTDPDSLLVEDDSGLRLSQAVRPGRLVMDRKTLEAIRAL